jgi:hypothetical protein
MPVGAKNLRTDPVCHALGVIAPDAGIEHHDHVVAIARRALDQWRNTSGSECDDGGPHTWLRVVLTGASAVMAIDIPCDQTGERAGP